MTLHLETTRTDTTSFYFGCHRGACGLGRKRCAAGRDDFAGVEKAASRIGYSPQMAQMCRHMGAGATGFTEQALAFHHAADSVGTAARQHDRAAVMGALGNTLQACTGCHETYRQHVVDEAIWTRLTSMSPPTGHHTGG